MKNVTSHFFPPLIFSFYFSILSAFPAVTARATVSLSSLPETCPQNLGGVFGSSAFTQEIFLPDIHTGHREDTDLTFLSITFNTMFHPAASAQTRTHILNTAAWLVGLGHLNIPQSPLSGKFWPRPRQSAGFD